MTCPRCGLDLEPCDHHMTAERCIAALRAVMIVAVDECRRLRRLADPTAITDEEIRFWDQYDQSVEG
jgi:hypothetical protein